MEILICKSSNLYCILAILLIILQDCRGKVKVKPKHRIVKLGSEAKYTCTSNVTEYSINWGYSKPFDPSDELVYNGAIRAKFRSRLNISEVNIDNTLRSTLSVMSVQMEDAGVFLCADEGGFGVPFRASLSVVDASGISCSAACVNDHLFVGCSTCYWGQDKLELQLQHHGSISSNVSSEIYDSQRSCNQLESLWSLKVACRSFDGSAKLHVLLQINSTNESLSSDESSLRSDEFDVLVNASLVTAVTSVSTHLNVTTEEDEKATFNPLMKEKDMTSLFQNIAIFTGIFAIISMMVYFIGGIYCRRYIKSILCGKGESIPLSDDCRSLSIDLKNHCQSDDVDNKLNDCQISLNMISEVQATDVNSLDKGKSI